ncbi:MAG: glutamyl-tRNA amidotransferase [Propionibacterium sp.]|nr:MAG: glutamyl-tRNA amidotransferase [Propionibacterium sp.]
MGKLKDQLRADLAVAMRAKDEAAKTNIRMTLGAIQNEEVAGAVAKELTDAEELAVVQREVRKRRDSAQAYRDGGREELAAKEEAEAQWLSRYLPEPLTEDEVAALVAEEIAKVDNPTMKSMGQIIKAVAARADGRAEGAVVARLTKQSLTRK